MDKYINVQGGLGLNISLASFITSIRDTVEDDFYILSPYYDIFESCEAVSGVYKPNEMRDFIFDAKENNGEICNIRLYDLNDFIYKRLNYSEGWAKVLGYDWKDTEHGTSVKSILNPLKAYPQLKPQIEEALKVLGDDFAIMQFTGGQSPLVQVPVDKEGKQDWSKVPYDYQNEPLKRHYPHYQEFVDLYHEKFPNRKILIYQLPNEPTPVGDFIVNITMPYLAYYELAKKAKEIVTIDSSLQHLTAGLTKTTVLWGHSLPSNFGYSYNNNIIQDCRRDDILYFTALGPSGARIKYIKPADLLNELEV